MDSPHIKNGHNYVKSIHENRWDGVVRPYSVDEVQTLRPVVINNPAIAQYGSEKFFGLVHRKGGVKGVGVDNPVEAINIVRGAKAVNQNIEMTLYLSGWMVAGNANPQILPDMGLYGLRDGSDLVAKLNNALDSAAKVDRSYGNTKIDWRVPVVADIEAGFGGINNIHEVTRNMIMAGAASVHIEDQDPIYRRCGHMSGKVVIPTAAFIEKLKATRLAADIYNVPTFIIARTDTLKAQFMAGYTEDMAADSRYVRGPGEKGLFPFGDLSNKGQNLEAAIERGLAYAPYADALWMETPTPDIGIAREFAQAIHAKMPGKILTYNLSPSFPWRANLNDEQIQKFMDDLVAEGYSYPFSTLPTWRLKGISTFEFAQKFFGEDGMLALADIQTREKKAEQFGYKGVKHQRAVGQDFYDLFSQAVMGENLKTAAGGKDSTEHHFDKK